MFFVDDIIYMQPVLERVLGDKGRMNIGALPYRRRMEAYIENMRGGATVGKFTVVRIYRVQWCRRRQLSCVSLKVSSRSYLFLTGSLRVLTYCCQSTADDRCLHR